MGLGGHLATLVRHPVLLWEAIRAFFAVRRSGALVPSMAYLEWRMHTAYGDASAAPTRDLLHYLAWRRNLRSLSRRWRAS